MSGIAVVVHADGQSDDRQLLAALAEGLQGRGPDGQTIHENDGPIGLVHARFQTIEEERTLPQPLSLDGTTWISADAQIGARNELRERLCGLGRQIAPSASDIELILHAWQQWYSASVDHLLGDFAFIIVDAVQQRVFAARDQLGIKPLFYARVGTGVVITNHLDCARLHPDAPTADIDSGSSSVAFGSRLLRQRRGAVDLHCAVRRAAKRQAGKGSMDQPRAATYDAIGNRKTERQEQDHATHDRSQRCGTSSG